MTGVIATIPRNQFFDPLGKPLAGGKLYTYLAGTTTPATTYQDQALTTQNENPIQLDSLGSCSIWLDPSKSYKFVLKSSSGVTQPGWPVDEISGASNLISLQPTLGLYTKLSQLAAPTGPTLIGFIQNIAGAVARLLQDKANELVSVEDFGDTGNGDDDTAVIQEAIDNATGELWFTKPTYRVDGQLTWKNGVIYRGRGVNIFGAGGTKITFNATNQDASKIVNPLNTSTPANISFRDLYLYAPSLEAEKAIIADTGSSYVTIEGCRIYSSGDCLHLDQSEIWLIEKTSFLLAGASSVGIWLINGPDKTIGSQPYFTNQITVRSSDFNGAAGSTHIRDDGGTSHTFEGNNHNAGGSHLIATGVNGLKIDGGEWEVSSAQTIILGLTKRKGGAGGKSPMVSINRTYLYNNSGQPVLAMVAGAVGKLEFTNNVISTIPGAAVTGLAVGCDQIDAQGNIQIGTVDDDIDLNNVLDVNPASVGWFAATTSPGLGNGTLAGSYSRRGKLVTLRQKITFGSTTTPGSGGYLFPLPFAADPSTFAQLGAGFILIPGVGFYAATARVTADGLDVELYLDGTTVVGAASPAAWVADSTIEFQITYVTAAPI